MIVPDLPLGYRFCPSDKELVGYFLKRKINGERIDMNPIEIVDLYKLEPWDLPGRALKGWNDREWFFYTARDKKYAKGSRTTRATKSGFWRSTGRDKRIVCKDVVGWRKTLVFYKGQGTGDCTKWAMHEYRLEGTFNGSSGERQVPYVLARIYLKNGDGSTDDAEHGDRLNEDSCTPLYEEACSSTHVELRPPSIDLKWEPATMIGSEAPPTDMSSRNNLLPEDERAGLPNETLAGFGCTGGPPCLPDMPWANRPNFDYQLSDCNHRSSQQLSCRSMDESWKESAVDQNWDRFASLMKCNDGQIYPPEILNAISDFLMREDIQEPCSWAMKEPVLAERLGGPVSSDFRQTCSPEIHDDRGNCFTEEKARSFLEHTWVRKDDSWKERIIDENLMSGENELDTGFFMENPPLDSAEDTGIDKCSLLTCSCDSDPEKAEIEHSPEFPGMGFSPMPHFDSQGEVPLRTHLVRREEPDDEFTSIFKSVSTPHGVSKIFHKNESSGDMITFAAEHQFVEKLPDLGLRRLANLTCDLDMQGGLASEGLEDAIDSSEDIGTGAKVSSLSSIDEEQLTLVQDDDLPFQTKPEMTSTTHSPVCDWQRPQTVPTASTQSADREQNPPQKPSRMYRLLPIHTDSLVESPEFTNTVAEGFDLQLNALHVIRSSSESGCQRLHAVVIGYAGGRLHQGVLSGTWRPCTESSKRPDCDQCNARSQLLIHNTMWYVGLLVFLLGVFTAFTWCFVMPG